MSRRDGVCLGERGVSRREGGTVAVKLNITHRLSGTTVRRIYGFVCRFIWLCIV